MTLPRKLGGPPPRDASVRATDSGGSRDPSTSWRLTRDSFWMFQGLCPCEDVHVPGVCGCVWGCVCIHVLCCLCVCTHVHVCGRMVIVVTLSQRPLPRSPNPNPWSRPQRTIEDLVDLKCPPNLLGTILGLPEFSFVHVGALFLQSATCDHRHFVKERLFHTAPGRGAPSCSCSCVPKEIPQTQADEALATP